MVVKSVLLYFTKIPSEQLIRHKFLRDEYPEATIHNQQNGKKLGKNDQRAGTGLSKTSPRCFLLTVDIKENIAEAKNFFIRPLICTLSSSVMSLERN